jgi:hypothetical protein
MSTLENRRQKSFSQAILIDRFNMGLANLHDLWHLNRPSNPNNEGDRYPLNTVQYDETYQSFVSMWFDVV